MNHELDFDAVLTRLAGRGIADRAFPAIDAALHSLTAANGGPELEDLLIRLVHQDQAEIAHAMLDETAGWVRDALDAEPRIAERWARAGRWPHTAGYGEARRNAIHDALTTHAPYPYGNGQAGLDERVVEYPWTFDRLAQVHPRGARVLDAGSTLNHREILDHWRARDFGPLSIVTLRHEGHAFPSEDVRYEYADLRRLPYRDEWFSTVLCISTLEHVGMDNGIYGDVSGRAADPERETRLALDELYRVLRPGGTLLVSVPFGTAADRGWQRIFDHSDIERLLRDTPWERSGFRVFRSFEDGWSEVPQQDAADAGYNDPHPEGRRDAPPWVAAAEAVALLELRRPDGVPESGTDPFADCMREGLACSSRADTRGALACFHRAVAHRRTPDALFHLATAHIGLGDHASAFPLLEELREFGEEMDRHTAVEALNALVSCCLVMERLDEAEGAAMQALALDPLAEATRTNVRALAMARAGRVPMVSDPILAHERLAPCG